MRFAGTQLSNFMGDTMDYSAIAGTSQKGRSMERRAAMEGEGLVANAGVQSLGKMRASEHQADGIKAQGQAQGQASMFQGMASGISSLAGGLASMPTGGSGGGGTITPSFGNSSTYSSAFKGTDHSISNLPKNFSW